MNLNLKEAGNGPFLNSRHWH